MSYWGYHLILNAASCAYNPIRCAATIGKFSDTLVKRIDMVPFGKPKIVMFGTGNKQGYTLVQLIETSNICAHFVEESNDIYLDVFSCKPFNPDIVRDIVNETFQPIKVDTKFIVRDARAQMQ